ncbi:hypothetical protein Csa_018975 [Cucumis sativus]|uniref:Ribosomal protein S14 n=1 Tax=Cucumis sativus TaxID=3659 RepID=A0A0A0KIM2_CUCSA|nr:hypothetical protein Csa_018975 [Cucumis sativus]
MEKAIDHLLIQREKRQKLEQKYHLIRQSLKNEIVDAPTRLHRCFLTGRPRANYQDLGFSGHILREMVHACLLLGMTMKNIILLF